MKNIVTIKTEPASLTVNYEAAKKRLEKELAEYDVVVTVDTVGDAKKLTTELNKLAAQIDTSRKDAVAKVSEPIKAFDEKMKSLVTMCRDGRQRLLNQIQVFEDETRAKVKELLIETRGELWDEKGVREEFRKTGVADLILLTSITGKGNLTAKAANELRARVAGDFEVQNETDRRLLELENKSFRAGLSAPLERIHVQSFLFADRETYEQELASLLQVEVARQHQAREIESKRQQATPAPAPETNVEKPKPEPVKSKPVKGKVTRIVTATFEVAVAADIDDDKIISKLRSMLENAGITSLTNIEVQ